MSDVTVNDCQLWYELKGGGTHLLEEPELSTRVVVEFMQRIDAAGT